jgi:hypothetical protein
MTTKSVTYDDALDVLRRLVADMLLLVNEEEGLTAAGTLEAYDDARVDLDAHAFVSESPADSRRIWIDTDGTIIVAVRAHAFATREVDAWIVYWASGKDDGHGSVPWDSDPGDISIADARRLVGLGGYV